MLAQREEVLYSAWSFCLHTELGLSLIHLLVAKVLHKRRLTNSGPLKPADETGAYLSDTEGRIPESFVGGGGPTPRR